MSRTHLLPLLALAWGCGSAQKAESPGGSSGTGAGQAGQGGTVAAGGQTSGGTSATAGTLASGGNEAGTAGSGAASGGRSGAAGSEASGNGGTGATGGTSPGGSGGNAGSDEAGGEGNEAGDSGETPTDPAPGAYGERPDLLAANSEMAVAELDGKIYVLGGYPASRVIQDAVQIYDIASEEWSLGTPLPVPIHHPVAVGLAGKIYSLGGQLTMGSGADTDRTLEYDPSTELWSDLAPMPTPRGAGAAAVIGDRIYVVGGRPPAGNAFEVYDVSEDEWTELPPLPTAINERNHLAAAAIGGKIYVAGGRYDGGSFSDPMTDAVDVFDPAENAWSSASPLPRPRGGVNGIAAHGCFHVWGGEGSGIGEPNDVFPDHDVYDPRSDTWTSLPPLPTPIHGVTGAAFVDGIIYMPGGGTQSGGSSGSALFQVYRPDLKCE
ncbi:MAG TPA: kelch repeat-containing protein [Polyangiaceae bacterium]